MAGIPPLCRSGTSLVLDSIMSFNNGTDTRPTLASSPPKEQTHDILNAQKVEAKHLCTMETNKKKSKKASKPEIKRTITMHLRTGDRKIDRDANVGFCNNQVASTKYTFITFLPKNLFEQFMRMANFYFLVLMCIALVPGLSPTTPITSVLPLIFVLAVTAVKQGREDYLRYRADCAINGRKTKVMANTGELDTLKYQNVKVGDLVYILPDEEFPCDLVLLATSANGRCLITTASLDGETGAKVRSAPSITQNLMLQDFLQKSITIETGAPNPDIYSLPAVINMRDTSAPEDVSTSTIDGQNFLPKGARLKATEWVVAMCIATGKDSKITLNQRSIPHKSSSAERRLNTFLIILMIILFVLCSLSVVAEYSLDPFLQRFYPMAAYNSASHTSGAKKSTLSGYIEIMIWDFCQFLILYSYLIPISLYVTLELQKLVGGLLIGWDQSMYDEDLNEPALARCTDLNDELGQIEHVFADKTGTLTQNVMEFRRCSIQGAVYDFAPATNTLEPITVAENSEMLYECAYTLAVCNSIQVTVFNEVINGAPVVNRVYTSSSSDEEALLKMAGMPELGISLLSRSPTDLEIDVNGMVHKHEILHTCEFESNRMRMSVITRNKSTGKTMLYCKGADARVCPRTNLESLSTNYEANVQAKTTEDLLRFARAGLRCMAVAQRELSAEETTSIMAKLNEATAMINGRDERLAQIYDEIESDMTYLGITSVEDKIQEHVERTMRQLRAAGIKMWVLTGDKMETAMSMSLSTGHISTDMKMMDATVVTPDDAGYAALEELLRIVKNDDPKDITYSYSSTGIGGRKTPAVDRDSGKYGHVLVIDGTSLAAVLGHSPEIFRELASLCAAVIGCRLSPIQKATVVRLIRNTPSGRPSSFSWVRDANRPVTLAIGDGANDVGMIREADIGVGIMGKEGREAANNSDYAFGKFQCLSPLILVHGHLCYYRNSYTIKYFFYKNFVFVLPLVLFGFFSLFSVEPLFDSWLMMGFNTVFTSVPVLLFGMFDRDLSNDDLLRFPGVHKDQLGNAHLTLAKFSLWALNGLVHGSFAFWGITLAMSTGPLLSTNIEADVIVLGTGIFLAVFLIVNARIMMDQRELNIITFLGMVVTFISMITFLCLYSGVNNLFGNELTTPNVYWSAFVLFSHLRFVLAMIVVASASIMFDLCINYYVRMVMPSPVHKVQAYLWRRKPYTTTNINNNNNNNNNNNSSSNNNNNNNNNKMRMKMKKNRHVKGNRGNYDTENLAISRTDDENVPLLEQQ